MSSNGRSVRVRGEKREQLDVARFARAIVALGALLKLNAEGDAKSESPNQTRIADKTSDASPAEDAGSEAEP